LELIALMALIARMAERFC